MSGEVIIHDATLNPTKAEVASRFGGVGDLLGTYRLADPAGEVGIEVLIGKDFDGRFVQLPLSYRGAELDPEVTLTEMDHSVLGQRWVSNALGDPVAVGQFIRTIIAADDGARRSDGRGFFLQVRGSGAEGFDEQAEVEDVEIEEFTRQRCVGTARIDGEVRAFHLRIPRLLNVPTNTGVEFHTAGKNLMGSQPESPEYKMVLAELMWRY